MQRIRDEIRRNLIPVLTIMFLLLFPLSVSAGEKWQGTDDLVDSKMEEVTGVSAKEPLVNIEGNLGLFLFAVGGFAAGAVVGYQWHKIFVTKAGKNDG
ncbi:hypothetical protein [Phosphitispora fastidiosa]|uniref:hypothetical protein n=1 Tax=Phosphitispora fastidiosa TaxID=2837202 RepID=UPI001E5417D4|nr:hypothetical protein [Phosphitispora fastidiosa]MBU7007044.1 ABC-type cobalt transport system substrate-binding protein [Phosphitispora fastidiosa]